MAMIIILLGLLLSISIILSTDGVLAVTRGLRRRWQQELPLCSFEGSGLIYCSRCCWNLGQEKLRAHSGDVRLVDVGRRSTVPIATSFTTIIHYTDSLEDTTPSVRPSQSFQF